MENQPSEKNDSPVFKKYASFQDGNACDFRSAETQGDEEDDDDDDDEEQEKVKREEEDTTNSAPD